MTAGISLILRKTGGHRPPLQQTKHPFQFDAGYWRQRVWSGHQLGSGSAPPSAIPSYIEKHLRTNARAWQYFQHLAPSYRRAYIRWIESAKQQETKERHLQEAVRLLTAGKKLGLK
jgi:hypothetical protein